MCLNAMYYLHREVLQPFLIQGGLHQSGRGRGHGHGHGHDRGERGRESAL
jgi:hypothetical protein